MVEAKTSKSSSKLINYTQEHPNLSKVILLLEINFTSKNLTKLGVTYFLSLFRVSG